LLATRVDNLIIERWMDVTAVATYAVALRITLAVSAFSTRVQRMITPIFGELHGRGDHDGMLSPLIDGTRLAFAITLPLTGGAIVLATPAVTSWIGPEMADSGPVLQVLLVSVLTSAVYEGVRGLLSMTGHHAVLSRGIFVGQVLNTLLSIALVGPFGLFGVAAGTVLGMVPVDIFVFQRVLSKELGVNAREFLVRTVWPSVIPGTLTLAALYGMCRLFEPRSLFWVACYEAACVILFVPLFWYLGATAGDRSFVVAKLQRIRHRF
jgi:O-antigen/teichoic acid export membrane protein